jgi:hypothetical protein
MKCFQYSLNNNGEGPAGRLPVGSLTGYFANNVYYGAAMIDTLSGLEDFNASEITPLQFNQTFKAANTKPVLSSFEPEVRKYYAGKMAEIVIPYTQEERDTWFVQLKEAQLYQANTSIDPTLIPMITKIADVRSLPVSDIATAIVDKNTTYSVAIGTVLGEQQALVQTLWTE